MEGVHFGNLSDLMGGTNDAENCTQIRAPGFANDAMRRDALSETEIWMRRRTSHSDDAKVKSWYAPHKQTPVSRIDLTAGNFAHARIRCEFMVFYKSSCLFHIYTTTTTIVKEVCLWVCWAYGVQSVIYIEHTISRALPAPPQRKRANEQSVELERAGAGGGNIDNSLFL